jgi:hypothetical protein
LPRGKYRSLVRLVSRNIMHTLVGSVDQRRFKTTLPAPGYYYLWDRSRGAIPRNPATAIGFDVNLKVVRRKRKGYDVFASVWADDTGNSHIEVEIHHNPNRKDHLSDMYYELCGSIRHEIEHISDEGALAGLAPPQRNLVPHVPKWGKIVHTLNLRAKVFSECYDSLDAWGREEVDRLNRSIDGNIFSYLTCYEEVGPITQGIYYEAKKRRCTVDEVLVRYLDHLQAANALNEAEYDEAYNHLIAWTKLTLPSARTFD